LLLFPSKPVKNSGKASDIKSDQISWKDGERKNMNLLLGKGDGEIIDRPESDSTSAIPSLPRNCRKPTAILAQI